MRLGGSVLAIMDDVSVHIIGVFWLRNVVHALIHEDFALINNVHGLINVEYESLNGVYESRNGGRQPRDGVYGARKCVALPLAEVHNPA